MNRVQHSVSSGIIAAVGLWVCIISYTAEPSEAFLFPRIISTAFVLLAAWTFIEAILGKSRVGLGLSVELVKNILPGLAVAVIYVYWLADTLGFFASAALAFFVLLSLYDSSPHNKIGSWLTRLMITAGYLAVMYGLFALLLKVYTPRGVLF